MNIRISTIAAALAVFCIAPAFAGESQPSPSSYGWGMMGQGAGSGMMGNGYGANMMGYGGGYRPGAMMGPGSMGGGCGMMGNDASGGDDTYADGRIAFLKAELKITDAQKSVWDDYADALRTNSDVMISMHRQMFSTMRQNDRSALTFLTFHINAMKARLAALEALKPATEALYKSLSEEQRKKADDVLPIMGCM